jgi:hypothetical protein
MRVGELARRATREALRRIEYAMQMVDALARRLVHPRERLRASRQLLAQLATRLALGAARRMDFFDAQIARLKASLASLNPEAVLERGYSLTRNAQGEVIRDAAKVQVGERLTTTLAKGWLESEIRKKAGRLMPMHCRIAPLAILALAACSQPQPQPIHEYAKPESRTDAQILDAATTPLSDLNIVRAEIPSALVAALKGPYARPADASCTGIAAEIRGLDAVLGADLDTPVTPINPSLIQHGVDMASELAVDAAMGAVRGAAAGIVPYRHWVRKLSGAERYSKEVAAAIAAGGVRRSYLKGFGQASGCPTPAAPRG